MSNYYLCMYVSKSYSMSKFSPYIFLLDHNDCLTHTEKNRLK